MHLIGNISRLLLLAIIVLPAGLVFGAQPPVTYEGHEYAPEQLAQILARVIEAYPEKADDSAFSVAWHLANWVSKMAMEDAKKRHPGLVNRAREPDVYQLGLDRNIIQEVTEEDVERIRAQNRAARLVLQQERLEDALELVYSVDKDELPEDLRDMRGWSGFARKVWSEGTCCALPESLEELRRHEENRLAEHLIRLRIAAERIERGDMLKDAASRQTALQVLRERKGDEPTDQEVERSLELLLISREETAYALEQLEKVRNIPPEYRDAWERHLQWIRSQLVLEQRTMYLSAPHFADRELMEVATGSAGE